MPCSSAVVRAQPSSATRTGTPIRPAVRQRARPSSLARPACRACAWRSARASSRRRARRVRQTSRAARPDARAARPSVPPSLQRSSSASPRPRRPRAMPAAVRTWMAARQRLWHCSPASPSSGAAVSASRAVILATRGEHQERRPQVRSTTSTRCASVREGTSHLSLIRRMTASGTRPARARFCDSSRSTGASQYTTRTRTP